MEVISLITPENGSVSKPLQSYPWPPEPEIAVDGTETLAAVEPIFWNDLDAVSEDRSGPRGVLFSWQPVATAASPIGYELAMGRESRLNGDARVEKNLTETRCEISNLFVGTRYYWQVTAYHAGRRIAESPVLSFCTSNAMPRWIGVDGMTNIRDLGGWPLPGNRVVRQGLVYRSSEMNGHFELGDAGRRTLLDELNIRTDLDFRSPVEDPSPALDTQRVKWISAPILPYDSIAEKGYKPAFREVFQVFADPANYPIIFHCWGGADRAGTVAFLLNGLLGVRLEHLI